MTRMKTSHHMSYFGPSMPSSIVPTGLKELTGLLEEANFITLLKTLRFNKCGFPLGHWGVKGQKL